MHVGFHRGGSALTGHMTCGRSPSLIASSRSANGWNINFLVLHIPSVECSAPGWRIQIQCVQDSPQNLNFNMTVKTSMTSISGDSHASTQGSDIDQLNCQLNSDNCQSNSEWRRRTKLCMWRDYCMIMVAGGRGGCETQQVSSNVWFIGLHIHRKYFSFWMHFLFCHHCCFW